MQSDAQSEDDAGDRSVLIGGVYEREPGEIHGVDRGVQQFWAALLQVVCVWGGQSAVDRQQNSHHVTIAYAALQHIAVQTQLPTTLKVPQRIRPLRHHHTRLSQRALPRSLHPRQVQRRG